MVLAQIGNVGIVFEWETDLFTDCAAGETRLLRHRWNICHEDKIGFILWPDQTIITVYTVNQSNKNCNAGL